MNGTAVESSSGGISVLHVDDEPRVAEVASRFLEQHDDVITTVVESDPEAALDRLDDEAFDCVVSDYQMPRLNGVELLRAVREEYPDLPFILFTGKGSEAVASDAIHAGVTDYLQKDRGTDQYEILARQIRNAVQKRRAEQRVHTYLEASPDGVIVVDTDGRIQRMNAEVESLFGYERSELLGQPVERLIPERFREAHVDYRNEYVESPDRRPMGVGLELYGLRQDGTEFPVDVSLSPVTIHGQFEVIASIRDATDRQRRESELAQLDRINTTLREATLATLAGEGRQAVLDAVCETLADADPYVFAWVGAVDDGRVEPVASAGDESGYLDSITITVDEQPTGQGPTGRAARSGEPQAVQDIPENAAYEPWRPEADRSGYRSSAAIPITYRDTRYGILNVYADRRNAFDDRELAALDDLGTTIGHGIYRAELDHDTP